MEPSAGVDAASRSTEADLDALRGLSEPMPMSEVEDVYLPLSRLLNLRIRGDA